MAEIQLIIWSLIIESTLTFFRSRKVTQGSLYLDPARFRAALPPSSFGVKPDDGPFRFDRKDEKSTAL
jgi:hypothetical protein